jgi:predicted nuclease with TOPRIM domain
MMRKTVALIALCLLPAACAGTAPTPSAATAGPPAKQGDEFLVVDCLLPGQVRQLGTSVTYVSARRAVKTSASDCRIRGGEYVALDRADYSTALRVWLPLAEQGDAAAQTNVGDIFEKRVPPDHAAAAEWYRKAAEKGNSRAAINLGNLYEQGLGVQKDPAQALNWYRRASGLKDLTFGTSAEAEERERLLRRQNEELRRELQAKQAEIDRIQKELEDARRTRQQRSGEIDTERARLVEDRKRLQEERQKLQESQQQGQQDRAGRVKDLERAIADAQTRLATKERELADARAAASGKSEQAVKREQQAAADAAAQSAKLDGLRRDLVQVQGEAQASRARVGDLERSILERESRLAAKDREMTELRVKITKLEEDAKARVRSVEETRQRVGGAAPEIQLIEPEILATRDTTPSVQASRGELTLVGKVVTARGLVSLMLNGREQPVDSSNIFKSKLAVTSPEQRVRIVAVDRDGRKSTLDFMIRERAGGKPAAVRLAQGSGVGFPLPPTTISFGNYHSLVIGNNEYKSLPKLKTAVNDAREIARILEKDYGFKVRLLLNATRYEILAALNDMRAKLTADDNLLVYYAGHGELDEKNQRGHWLPVDAEPESSANWISSIQITDLLNVMTARKVFVVADSCYAGILTRSAVSEQAGGMTNEERLKWMQVMAQSRSRIVMTSGGVEPVLDMGGGKHSVFAQSIVEVLQQNDGVLPGQDLFKQLQPRVFALADRVQGVEKPQVPAYAPIKFAGHESGDFFFVRRAN